MWYAIYVVIYNENIQTLFHYIKYYLFMHYQSFWSGQKYISDHIAFQNYGLWVGQMCLFVYHFFVEIGKVKFTKVKNFLNNCLIAFSLFMQWVSQGASEGTDAMSKDGYDWIVLKIIYNFLANFFQTVW